jgi:signal transduction histidine kinase
MTNLYLTIKRVFCIGLLFFSTNLSAQQPINLHLNDTLTITPALGETWCTIHVESSSKQIVLDVFNADCAEFYTTDNQIIDHKTVEFHLHRTEYEKHFIIDLAPSVQNTIKLKLVFLKKKGSKPLQFIVIGKSQIDAYIEHQFYGHKDENRFVSLMIGIFFLQIIYYLILSFSYRQAICYFLLLFCFEYTRLCISVFQYQLGWDIAWLTYPNNVFVSTFLGLIFYALFLMFFFPSIKKIVRFAVFYFALNLFIYSLLTLKHDLILREQFADYAIPFSYIFSFLLLYAVLRLKDPVKYYLWCGAILLILGGVIDQVFQVLHLENDYDYYAISMVAYVFDFIMLNLALNYRRIAEKRAQRLQLDSERNRIAAEMHDDLGSGLLTIRLLSERAEMGFDTSEMHYQIQKITHEASDLIERMVTIIWSTNSQNDTILNLIDHLRAYAFDYLKETNNLQLDFPVSNLSPSVSKQNLDGNIRREVFLTFKEALHNIIKHAKATETGVSIQYSTDNLVIKITDNGVGVGKSKRIVDSLVNLSGNGLRNMAERMARIDGNFEILSRPSGGTQIILSFPTNKS